MNEPTAQPPDLSTARQLAEEAKERAEKATEGPWTVEVDHDGDGEPGGRAWTYVSGVEQSKTGRVIFRFDDDYGTDQRSDADFIASARSDVPSLANLVLSLADEVERLQAERDRALAFLWKIARAAESGSVDDPVWLLPNRIKHLANIGMGKQRAEAQELSRRLDSP